MDRRFVTFLMLSLGIILLWMLYQANLAKKRMEQQQVAQQQAAKDKQDGADQPAGKAGEKTWLEDLFDTGEPVVNAGDETDDAEPPPEYPHQLVTLGSLAPDCPYRYLVTLDTQGATIRRIELNERTKSGKLRYVDIDDDTGYLGHLGLQNASAKEGAPAEGCRVTVVGPGTPAAKAKVQVGDVITHVNGQQVKTVTQFIQSMKETEPGDEISLTVKRAGQPKPLKLKAKLMPRPLEIVKPEPDLELDPKKQDPLSMRVTLRPVDNDEIGDAYSSFHDENWDVETVEKDGMTVSAAFEYQHNKLKLVKRYTLIPTPQVEISNPEFRSYHVSFEVEIVNLDESKSQKVAYQLDGPTGLPIEGWWSPMKVHPNKLMGGAGPRDVIGKMAQKGLLLKTAPDIADNWLDDEVSDNYLVSEDDPPESRVLQYAGVDTQYFAAMLLPAGDKENRIKDFVFRRGMASPVGTVTEDDNLRRTNISFQLISEPITLDAGAAETRKFLLFAGPNKPSILESYGLEDVKEYGWYGWIAKPLTWLLHRFYWLIPNYGIAIIMLTVVVRLCMVPLSRKAAKNAEMMKLLQPEMKKIQEKNKKDMQKRAQAQRELFARYKYNPLGGCLLMLLQLPVFIGLYRGLSIDNALRGEPLIPGLGWCSNLAAPDQFLYWGGAIPFLTGENGFLGPYLNILPLMTVALFIAQQKILTPPAQDDQQRATQRIMMFMTVFIGFLFFKVPSGLCVYFITSSLWGLAERKLLPKPKLPESLVPLDQREPSKPGKSASKPSGNGAAARKAKDKARQKLRQKRK